jgi:hypothetical protein
MGVKATQDITLVGKSSEAVLYLVRADYVTGEVLFVDGGARWA